MEAEKEGKPTWRTAIRSDIREAVKASYSWTQFIKEMEQEVMYGGQIGNILALKAPRNGTLCTLTIFGKRIWRDGNPGVDLKTKIRETEKVYLQWSKQRKKRTGL